MHIEPGNSFAAAGIWMPEPGVLVKIRQEIDYNFKDWKKIISSGRIRKMFPEGIKGESLTRPPKGYDENNPAITFLKMKSFILSTPLTDATLKSKTCTKELTVRFREMKPLVDFINLAAD